MKKILVITSSLISIYDQLVELSKYYDIYGIYVFERYSDLSYNKLKLYHVAPPKRVFSFAEVRNIVDYVIIIPTLLKIFYISFRLMIKENIDVVYAHWIIPSGFIAAIYKKLFYYLFNKKLFIVITARGSDIKICLNKNIFKQIILFTINQANVVIAINNDIKKILLSYGVKKKKIKVVYPGIDVNKFKPLDKYELRRALNYHENDFIVIYIGNLIKLKNVDKLIKIIKTISIMSNVRLIIIGDGTEKQNLEKLVSDLDMNNVYFLGALPNIMMPRYLSLSDILVLPSKSEGLPLCVQEAMLCGVPVIVTNVGGLSSIVYNNYNGFIVENVQKIEEVLQYVIENPTIMPQLKINSLNFARNNFSLENTVNKTLNIFNEFDKN